MSQAKKFIMTYEGVKKLEEELEYLKTVKRKEITEKIKVALGYGDLSENSEYDEAKNDQAFTEGRILQLENMLKNAQVVDESEIPSDTVSVGAVVKVMDYDFDEEVEYTIVGSAEADPMNFKISNESPVGEALLGKKIGDIVEVAVPEGISKFEVLGIRRA
ncbi:transcription elongation factor GreA [Clostridium saudiense]|nr:transcription elongation factor GreA [Clostridium saudiense]MBM6859258.1 transcription elongation factor GreA [Clostridium saudiense]